LESPRFEASTPENKNQKSNAITHRFPACSTASIIVKLNREDHKDLKMNFFAVHPFLAATDQLTDETGEVVAWR
jgi:hypothetical protein